MTRISSIIGILTLLSASISLASAAEPPATPPSIKSMASHWHQDRAVLKQALQLSPEQQAAWDTFVEATNDPTTHLQTLDMSPPMPTPEDALSYMAFMADLKTAMALDTRDWLAQVRTLDNRLDAEQKQALDDFLQNHDAPFTRY